MELLDEYLGNRLNEKDKTAFEKAMESDPSLKKEFIIQKRIVDGIRKGRVLELKKMLNDIPVSSIPQQGPSLLTQVGAVAVVAGLVGTGLFFYLKDDGKGENTTSATTDKEQLDKPVQAPEEKTDSQATSEQALPQPEVNDNDSNVKDKAEQQAIAPETEEQKEVSPSARDVFEPGEEQPTSESAVTEDSKTSTGATPSIAVKTEPNSKYSWHYQFRDNKLYLYGVFEKNLYEIMEFFSDNKRTMFLYYKDNYYLLNEEDNKVRPLNAIGDKALLKKLKDYRAAQ